MRLTLRLFGREILHVSTDPDPEPDDPDPEDPDRGSCTTTQVGYTARWDLPDGAERPGYP